MKNALIPKSKAKNAHALLSEVRRLILAEPKRYDQRNTLAVRNGRNHECYDDHEFPACGTIGCVAGWVTALKAKRPDRIADVLPYAQRALRLTDLQAYELFYSGAAAGASQTADHAQAGARHIAAFQRAHRAQLLAKKV